MDGRGRVFDNVFIERLRRSVKYEEVYLHSYESIRDARNGLVRYFRLCNTERFHKYLGYRTPHEVFFEKAETTTHRLDQSTLKEPISCLENGEGFSQSLNILRLGQSLQA